MNIKDRITATDRRKTELDEANFGVCIYREPSAILLANRCMNYISFALYGHGVRGTEELKQLAGSRVMLPEEGSVWEASERKPDPESDKTVFMAINVDRLAEIEERRDKLSKELAEYKEKAAAGEEDRKAALALKEKLRCQEDWFNSLDEFLQLE